MYVTSDCHEVWTYEEVYELNWQEVLLAGVSISGPSWAGAEEAITFLCNAWKEIGMEDRASFAGYNLGDEVRTRNVKPSTFLESFPAGRWKPKSTVSGVLLRGYLEEPAPGKSSVVIGGEIGVVSANPAYMLGGFVFPYDDSAHLIAESLLEYTAINLNAAYGHYFIRDNAFFPDGYVVGMSGGQGSHGSKYQEELEDIETWSRMKGTYWESSPLKLRDLYEINLVSDRHLNNPIAAVSLHDWIKSDSGRGSLRLIGNGRWIWTVKTGQLHFVRRALTLAGMIVSRHTPVYRSY